MRFVASGSVVQVTESVHFVFAHRRTVFPVGRDSREHLDSPQRFHVQNGQERAQGLALGEARPLGFGGHGGREASPQASTQGVEGQGLGLLHPLGDLVGWQGDCRGRVQFSVGRLVC